MALRLARAGHEVVLGSRDAARAAVTAEDLIARGGDVIRGASNEEAATSEFVVLATPWDSTVATVSALRETLASKIVISMVNALVREGRELVPLYPPRGSMAAQVAAALPASRIVGAFHHLPAATMEDLGSDLDADVLVFSDDDEARRRVAALIDEVDGLHSIVAGSMSLASAVEAFTAVCISINIRYKAHSYVKMAGLSQ